jgi:hypothetical protein
VKPWQPDPDGSSIRGFQEIQGSDMLVIPNPTRRDGRKIPCRVALIVEDEPFVALDLAHRQQSGLSRLGLTARAGSLGNCFELEGYVSVIAGALLVEHVINLARGSGQFRGDDQDAGEVGPRKPAPEIKTVRRGCDPDALLPARLVGKDSASAHRVVETATFQIPLTIHHVSL